VGIEVSVTISLSMRTFPMNANNSMTAVKGNICIMKEKIKKYLIIEAYPCYEA
jgi:hypothetical protein